MVKAVIFDLDGTLLDTMLEWENIGANYLKSLGLEPEYNINEILKPLSLEEASEYFIKKYKVNKTSKEILDDINSLIAEQYENHLELKDGVLDVLNELKEKNIKMCVATATEHDLALSALKRLNIDKYFEFVLTCGEVGYSKKYPTIYIEATNKLGLTINDIIIFEDSLMAMKSAKAAGFKIVGIYDIASRQEQEEIKEICDKYILKFEDLKSGEVII